MSTPSQVPASENPAGLGEQPTEDRLCRLEFLVEPFSEGNPGPHVLAPLHRLRRQAIQVNQGPFGNTVEGDRRTVTTALLTILEGAFDNGASRILINLSQGEPDTLLSHARDGQSVGEGPGIAHRRGVIDDPPVSGRSMLGATRPEDIHGAVDRIVSAVEDQMGGALGDLSREKKQAAVRILDEQGVFLIRKSVETVAEAMGVSRITIYNYLNAIRGD